MVMFSGVGLVVCAVCAAASSGLRESPAAPAEGVLVTLADNRTVLVSTEFIRSQGADSFPEDVTMTEALLNRNPFLDGSCSLRLMPTADDMDLCIKKYEWNDHLNLIGNSRRSTLDTVLSRTITEDMPVNDCFLPTRNMTRTVPTDCYYTDPSGFNWDTWLKFYEKVLNDLRFTFDFVLFEERFRSNNIVPKEHNIWYLIQYFKGFITSCYNPYDLKQNFLQQKKRLKALRLIEKRQDDHEMILQSATGL